jgi:hypothetical protein
MRLNVKTLVDKKYVKLILDFAMMLFWFISNILKTIITSDLDIGRKSEAVCRYRSPGLHQRCHNSAPSRLDQRSRSGRSQQ